MSVFDLDGTHGKKIFHPAEICCGNYSNLFETGETVTRQGETDLNLKMGKDGPSAADR